MRAHRVAEAVVDLTGIDPGNVVPLIDILLVVPHTILEGGVTREIGRDHAPDQGPVPGQDLQNIREIAVRPRQAHRQTLHLSGKQQQTVGGKC